MKRLVQFTIDMFLGFTTFVLNIVVFAIMFGAALVFFPIIAIAAIPFLVIGGLFIAIIATIAIAFVIAILKFAIIAGIVYVFIVIINTIRKKHKEV